MLRRALLLTGMLLLAACGGQAGGTSSTSSSSSSNSSSSSSSSSSSNSSSGQLSRAACAVCDEADKTGELVVISAALYQSKLATVLGEPMEIWSDGVSAYSGRALFNEQAHMEQQIAVALEAFYRNAEWVANRRRAVTCNQLSTEHCGAKFIQHFVEPLFERELTAAERRHYLAFFREADVAELDGQRAAMIAALSSPNFLFRKEVGVE